MAELDDQLSEVNAAIEKLVLTGGGVKSYTISLPGGGTRSVTRENLKDLREWRAELQKEISQRDARSAVGGTINYGTRGRI